jgi:hypothetical protein
VTRSDRGFDPPGLAKEARMTVISTERAMDEGVTCLRIFADDEGETHMEDVIVALQPKKLFKDNPPLRLTDNLAAIACPLAHG